MSILSDSVALARVSRDGLNASGLNGVILDGVRSNGDGCGTIDGPYGLLSSCPRPPCLNPDGPISGSAYSAPLI